jgi:hypothetical protein
MFQAPSAAWRVGSFGNAIGSLLRRSNNTAAYARVLIAQDRDQGKEQTSRQTFAPALVFPDGPSPRLENLAKSGTDSPAALFTDAHPQAKNMRDDTAKRDGQKTEGLPSGEAHEAKFFASGRRISVEQARQLIKAHFATIAQRAGVKAEEQG